MGLFTPESLTNDVASVAGSLPLVGGYLGDQTKKAMQDAMIDGQSKPDGIGGMLSGALGWVSDLANQLMRGLHSFLGPLISPNSYNAEQVLEAKIDQSNAFDNVQKACGVDGLAGKLREICKNSMNDYVGFVMPGDPTEALKLQRADGSMQEQLTGTIYQALYDKNKGLAKTPDQLLALQSNLKSIASAYAYSITGFNPKIGDSKGVDDDSATEIYKQFPPTTGLAATLRKVQMEAMGEKATGTLLPFFSGAKASFTPDKAHDSQYDIHGDAAMLKSANDALGDLLSPAPQKPAPNKNHAHDVPAADNLTPGHTPPTPKNKAQQNNAIV